MTTLRTRAIDVARDATGIYVRGVWEETPGLLTPERVVDALLAANLLHDPTPTPDDVKWAVLRIIATRVRGPYELATVGEAVEALAAAGLLATPPRDDEARIERAARAVYPHLTGEEWDDERFAFVAAMAREIAQDALAAADQEEKP